MKHNIADSLQNFDNFTDWVFGCRSKQVVEVDGQIVFAFSVTTNIYIFSNGDMLEVSGAFIVDGHLVCIASVADECPQLFSSTLVGQIECTVADTLGKQYLTHGENYWTIQPVTMYFTGHQHFTTEG